MITKAKVRNMSVVGYTSGWTLWLYKDTKTALADMLEPGFFGDGFDEMVATGDIIVLVGTGHTAQRVIQVREQGKITLAQVF